MSSKRQIATLKVLVQLEAQLTERELLSNEGVELSFFQAPGES